MNETAVVELKILNKYGITHQNIIYWNVLRIL